MKTMRYISIVLLMLPVVLFGQGLLDASYVVSPEDSLGFAGYRVELNITGGVPPYTVDWCELGTSGVTVYEALMPGNYRAKIYDTQGDMVGLEIEVSDPIQWDSIIPQWTENRLGEAEDGYIEFGIEDTLSAYIFGFTHEGQDTIDITAGFMFIGGMAKMVLDGTEVALPMGLDVANPDWKYKVARKGQEFVYYVNGLKIYAAESLWDELRGSPGLRAGYKTDDLGFTVSKIKGLTGSMHKSLNSFYYPFSLDCNEEMNWIYSEAYDGNNIPIAAGIQFFNNFGKPMQAQARHVSAGKVLCTETRYDIYGRKVLETLPAPKLSSDFCYVQDFITVDIDHPGGTMEHRKYEIGDFDTETTLNSPLPVSQIQQGELGWYYSNNNTLEDRVPATDYPYSRVEYYNDPMGAVKRSSSAGEAYKMGADHEVRNFVMPALGELYSVYGGKYITDVLQYQGMPDNAPEGLFEEACERPYVPEFKAYKHIMVDPHGEESVTFKDIDGKVLATCLSGPVNGTNVHEQPVFVLIGGGEYRDIHIPAGCEATLDFSMTILPGAGYPSDDNTCTDLTFNIYDIDKNYEPVALNATSAYFDGGAPGGGGIYLLPGYYRIKNNKPLGSDCYMRFKYTLNYYNFSLYYYDESGRLIATVPPEGVDYPDPQVISEVDRGCAEVDDLVRVESSDIYTYNDEFGFDDIPTTPEGASQKTLFDISLDFTCTPGSVGPPPPLGSGLMLMALLDHPFYNHTSFSGNLYDQPLNTFGGSSGPPQQPEAGDIVGNATVYRISLVPTAYPSGLPLSTSDNYVTLAYVKTSYTTNEHLDGSGNPVSKYGFGKFFCNDLNAPFNNKNLEMGEVLSCNNGEVRFEVTNIEKYTTDIRRGTMGGPSGPETIDWLDWLLLQDEYVNPQTEPNLNGLKILYKRNTQADYTEIDHKLVESQEYNTLGQVKWKYMPDEGRTDYLYRKDGGIRFSQNEQQRADFKFSYSNYDNAGRIIEIGEYDAGLDYNSSGTDACQNVVDGLAFMFLPHLALLDPPACFPPLFSPQQVNTSVDVADPLEDERCKDVIRTTYDAADVNLSTLDDMLANRLQRYVRGRICKTERFKLGSDAVPYSVTWYSYNELGRVEWEVQYIDGLGYKTIDYEYDFNGNTTVVAFQKDMAPEKFIHYYTYNKAQQLTSVFTQDEANTITVQAKYQYYLHGPLKRQEVNNNLQGVDFTYAVTGALKAINNANLDDTDPGRDGYSGSHSGYQQDLFGMELDYHANDYARNGTYFSDGMFDNNGDNIPDNTFAEQFNGNIKSMRWKTRDIDLVEADVSGTPTVGYQNMYGFNYDRNTNWMLSANLGSFTPDGMTLNGQAGPYLYATGKYSEDNLSYSLNGNILGLKRTGASTADMDDLEYHYDAVLKNRLLHIDDAAGSTVLTSDLEDQAEGNYVYNAIGQMTEDNSAQDDQAVDYDAYGKVITVWTADRSKKKVAYLYNANGHRVKKTTYTTAVGNAPVQFTYYINNSAGRTMRIVEKSPLTIIDAPPTTQHYETPIYGASRIGVRYSDYEFDEVNSRTGTIPGGYTYDYENPAMMQTNPAVEYQLGDHLGNVRVVFRRGEGGIAERLGYADYYPMGMVLPGRQEVSANGYRYGYQGEYAEKTGETGWNDFELRSYDSRIGRWMVIDPAHQYWSPYMSMGNNWIIRIDPNGGNDEDGTDIYPADFVGPLPQDGVRTPLSQPITITQTSHFEYANMTLALPNHDLINQAANFFASAVQADGPYPVGDLIGAAVYTAAVVYVVSGMPELIEKMESEIERLKSKLRSTPGYQYSLRARLSGYYPDVRGGLTYLNAGDVWKFGETSSNNRYSDAYKATLNVYEVPEFYGNKTEIKIVEKMKIYNYFLISGSLPPGNRIFR